MIKVNAQGRLKTSIKKKKNQNIKTFVEINVMVYFQHGE